MRRIPRSAVALALILAAGSDIRARAQEDAGVVRPGDRSPRGEIEDLFDDGQQPAGDPDQLVSEGWAAYNRGLELRSKAAEEVEKKRKKMEKQAARAFAESERSFTAALQQDGELVEGYIGLARTWSATGEIDKSLQAWGEAYRRAPQREEVLLGLGDGFMAAGRTRDAASVYNELKQHSPEAADRYLERLRGWAEERSAEGDEEAAQLVDWIDQQI
jgi:tetratricopeptide (TPR) repeat protein